MSPRGFDRLRAGIAEAEAGLAEVRLELAILRDNSPTTAEVIAALDARIECEAAVIGGKP